MYLVRDAIAAGIFNDLVGLIKMICMECIVLNYLLSLQGSGSNVDLCVITADKTEYIRPFDEAAKKGPRYTLSLTLLLSFTILCVALFSGPGSIATSQAPLLC